MKVTEPIDVYLADKLFQLTSEDRLSRSPTRTTGAPAGNTVVVFGSTTASAPTSPGSPATTEPRSRILALLHGHPRGAAAEVAAAEEVLAETGRVDPVVNTAGILPRGAPGETSEEAIYAATDVTTSPRSSSRRVLPAPRGNGGSLLLFTSSSYTRGRSGYSLSLRPRPPP